MLLVEQNAKMALEIANRAYVLETGKIKMEGEAHELANNIEVRKAYLGWRISKTNDLSLRTGRFCMLLIMPQPCNAATALQGPMPASARHITTAPPAADHHPSPAGSAYP